MKTCSLCKRSWDDEFRLCPIDGTPLQDAPIGSDPYIGQTIAQCRLVEKIAEGDLGPIYKAEEPIRGVVAVQLTPPARVASPILMEAFTDAVNHVAKLHHPHVIRVYGIEVTAAGAAVVMEYVSGANLAAYRRSHPATSPVEACRLIRQAAEGILAAHRMSLLHAALHPTRLLVNTDGNVKVGGFHRSGLREGVDAISVTPDNLPYLSPEQMGIVRDVSAPDYRTDVYALGIILYELLVGRLPYAAASPQDLAVAMEKSPPVPASFANPQVPPVLGRVVNRAISMHPAERQGSMEEFIRELDAASQTAREAAPGPRYEPPYAPTGQDARLFGAPSPDKGIPGRSSRRESLDDIWPEGRQASEEKSFFSWFKSRSGVARPSGRRFEPRRRDSDSDESDASVSFPARHREDYTEERTVLVTDRKRRRNKDRSFIDSFTSGWSRDSDLSGTGTLPDRPWFKNKVYQILVAAVVVLVIAVGGFIYWVVSEDEGILNIDSKPRGAEVRLDGRLRGSTPFHDRLKTGSYQLSLKLPGFTTEEDTITLTKEGFQQEYILSEEPIAGPPPPTEPQAETPSGPPANPPPARARLEDRFHAALRVRQFFPPDSENAWDILQDWQRAERGEASDAILQARQKLCRAVEEFGNEKLKRQELMHLRALLEKNQTHRPTPSCGSDLQKAYDKEMSDLRADVLDALDRHKYVLPESESALKFVQLILGIDPEDAQAREWKKQIFDSAWKEAQTRGGKRQHQEALQIYGQLKQKYPDPPAGISALQQAIEKQEAKLAQWQKLSEMFSLVVRHPHGRSYKSMYIKSGECDGTLRFNGFDIEYKSSKEPAHSFKIPYEGLKLSAGKKSIVFESPRLPDKTRELEQKEKDADIAKHYAKLQDLIGLNAEYMKP
jgi:serine/threonine protein kinase